MEGFELSPNGVEASVTEIEVRGEAGLNVLPSIRSFDWARRQKNGRVRCWILFSSLRLSFGGFSQIKFYLI